MNTLSKPIVSYQRFFLLVYIPVVGIEELDLPTNLAIRLMFKSGPFEINLKGFSKPKLSLATVKSSTTRVFNEEFIE